MDDASKREPEALSDDAAPCELKLGQVPHLAAPFGGHLASASSFGLDLPYHLLGGPGFERLCFHLLLAQGQQARFFGLSGNAQYGIDLIVSEGKSCTVYQCKNRDPYTAADLRGDLDLFALKWLVERPNLRRPECFVLCCTSRLTERDRWEDTKQKFYEQHRVKVIEWHRDTLDTWLRDQPDIVSDLFGDQVAERFCRCDEWNNGLFRPLLPASGSNHVERYLERRAAGRLIHDPANVKRFDEILREHRFVLIEGVSGSGKTMAALDFASSFDDGAWRIFYVTLRHQADENQLFLGIKERTVRPTLFILDDCYRDLVKIEAVVSRVRYALSGRPFGLVLAAQTAPSDAAPSPNRRVS